MRGEETHISDTHTCHVTYGSLARWPMKWNFGKWGKQTYNLTVYYAIQKDIVHCV